MTSAPRTVADVGDPDWTSDPLDPPAGGAWDLLVVGGGTAGLVGAQTAASLGARVLLVERSRTGGDCLWTGCVPSKSLLAAAHAAADARAAAALGVHVDGVRVDFGAVRAHVRAAVRLIEPVDSPDRLRRSGVAVAHGSVRLTGPGAAEVDGRPVRARQVLLATGSEPTVPDLPGLEAPLTSDSVWDLEELPARLLVIGGGPVGCELGQAFARLGSHVVLVQHGERLLPREHPDASRAVTDALRADGVDVRTARSVASVGGAGATGTAGHVAVLDDGSRVVCDHVLVAAGRRPRTAGLGLEAAGVQLDGTGHVVVDAHLRTTTPGVWAAGDLTPHPPFTHTAGVHGSLAASNAVLGLRRSVAPDLVPRITYTQPEVAAFGRSADAPGVTVRRTDHDEVDRAVAEGRTAGWSELVLDGRGRVVGATVVGPRAGEVLAEAVLAAQVGARARTLAGTVHAYPSWSDGLWKAALAQGRADLASPWASRATRALVATRRAWLERRGPGSG